MHEEQTSSESSVFAVDQAPPTQAGDFVPVTPPEGWPTVLGVLSVIFGGLGILNAGCGAAMMVVIPSLISFVPEGPEREELAKSADQSLHYVPFHVVSESIEFVLAIFLLVGGIQLLKRSAGAVKSLLIFAIGDLFSNILALILGIMTSLAQAKMVAEDPDMPQVQKEMVEAFSVIGIVAFWIPTMIWPIFLLLWFRRAKIRSSVARWGDGAEPHGGSSTAAG